MHNQSEQSPANGAREKKQGFEQDVTRSELTSNPSKKLPLHTQKARTCSRGRGSSFSASMRSLRSLGSGSFSIERAQSLRWEAARVADTILNRKHFVLAGVAFVTGFANVVTYLKYGQIYCTIVTGNLIVATSALVEGDTELAILAISICVAYFIGSFVARFVISNLRWDENRLIPLILLMMSSLAYFAHEDQVHSLVKDIVSVSLFAGAMGMVNTITSLLDGITTQMITGHVHNIAALAASGCYTRFGMKPTGGHDDGKEKNLLLPKVRLARSVGIITWFAAGVGVSRWSILLLFDDVVPSWVFAAIGMAFSWLLILRKPIILPCSFKWHPKCCKISRSNNAFPSSEQGKKVEFKAEKRRATISTDPSSLSLTQV